MKTKQEIFDYYNEEVKRNMKPDYSASANSIIHCAVSLVNLTEVLIDIRDILASPTREQELAKMQRDATKGA